ncbi:AraC family transcriptional regulator [Parapedobacter sp. 10938]|uniref:AraC family transcriptional regulator n=1 Tax=Parapedobacter flavus TaxID=3110225 RepID=UPI002DB92202|nr:AraC family transcriptional regulator [Parapedobacter sp. 10938]MEC3881946.1 AraC family transcriptional regulator [Parapedobacter sp. 10938]
METTITISFAQAPDRPAKALLGPVKESDYLLPYAKYSLLDHSEATLHTQLVAGWQFSLNVFTADAARGQTMRLQVAAGQALFVYQLKGRIHRLLHGGTPFQLVKDHYCGCYLPAGTYLFNLPPGKHETLVVAFPYGYLVWLTRQNTLLHPLINAWKNNGRHVLCLNEATMLQDERRTLQRIRNCPKRGDELDGALKVYLARLLGLYHERLQQLPTGISNNAMLDSVQAHIEAHYAEKYPMRFKTISRQFGCTPAKLRQAYAARYGTTIAEAVRMQRIHAAKLLLLDTDLPLTTIAEQVGFMYAESLIRAFKRETGLTPMAFRQQH